MIDPSTNETLISLALAEDIGPGDRTTEWTVPPGTRGRGTIVAKAPSVVAGTAVAVETFRAVDPDLLVELNVGDGDVVTPGDRLLELDGALAGILRGERVALNFLTRLSGIATLTKRFVDAVAGTGATILDTRKTTPGWRKLEKAAVAAGGGSNHRHGLFDMVLVKDNHIVASGGIRQAVLRVKERNAEGIQVEVEVTTMEELEEVLPLGVDRVLLDNMDLEGLAAAVARLRAFGPDAPRSEASGNMTLDRVRAVAETGVDFISVGALTHSAPGADLSLRITDRWKDSGR